MNFSYNISSLRNFLCISGLFLCILRVRLFLCRAGLLGRDDGLNTVDGRAERVEFFLIAGHNADRAVRVQIVGDIPQFEEALLTLASFTMFPCRTARCSP